MFDKTLLKSNATNSHKDGRPKRVVFVHPSAGVNWSGGSEIFALELSRRLTKYFDVELLSGFQTESYSKLAGGIARTHSYDFFRHPLLKPLWQRITKSPEILLEHTTSFLPCAMRLLAQPADVIFPCNDYGGLAMAAFVRSMSSAKILYTEHSGLLGEGRCLARSLKFHPDHLVVFSEEMTEFALRLNPQQKLSIIPNGVDVDRFQPDGPQFPLSLPKPIVLCVASLRKEGHKRIELAIEAVSQLSSGSLLLCGDGPDRTYFAELGKAKLGNRFAIVSLPYAQMPELYRAVDIFTLPSKAEPFGLVYVEAMASGLPVVATEDPMRSFIVGKAGILCDVTNLSTYSNALKTAIATHWSTLPRENAMRFSWDHIALQYCELISKLSPSTH
jgi:glycosyltransferase involved in cell wall biosynthesis